MLYAALTFWLLIVVFTAYGVYQLWAGMIQPKFINAILLPGTVVVHLGRTIGLLIAGGSASGDASAAKPSAKNDAPAATEPKPAASGGSFVVALLPIIACGLSMYFVAMTVGRQVVEASGESTLTRTLPASFDSLWELLRSVITLVEQVTLAVRASDFGQWQSWAFIYLIVCLTVRLAPLPGTQRAAIGAIVFLGLAVAIIGVTTQATPETMQGIWNMLSFSLGSLLFLLLLSLLVRGVVGLFRILTNQVPA